MTSAAAAKIPKTSGNPFSLAAGLGDESSTEPGVASGLKAEPIGPARYGWPSDIPPRPGNSDNPSAAFEGRFAPASSAAPPTPEPEPAGLHQSAPAAASAPVASVPPGAIATSAPASTAAASAPAFAPAPASAPAPAPASAPAAAPAAASAPAATPAVKAAAQTVGAVYKEIQGVKKELTEIREKLIREAGFGDIKRGAGDKIGQADYWAAELEFTLKTEAAVALLKKNKTANSEMLLGEEMAQLKAHATAFAKLQQVDPKVYYDSKIFSDVYYGMVDMLTAATPITPGNAAKFSEPLKELAGAMVAQETNPAAAAKDPSQAALYTPDAHIKGALAGLRSQLSPKNAMTLGIQAGMEQELCKEIDALGSQWSALPKVSEADQLDQQHQKFAANVKRVMKKAVEAVRAQAAQAAGDAQQGSQPVAPPEASSKKLPTTPAAEPVVPANDCAAGAQNVVTPKLSGTSEPAHSDTDPLVHGQDSDPLRQRDPFHIATSTPDDGSTPVRQTATAA